MERYIMSLFSSDMAEKKMTELIDAQIKIYHRNYTQKHGNDQIVTIPGEYLCRLSCFKRVMVMMEKGFLQKTSDEPKTFKILDLERWQQAKS